MKIFQFRTVFIRHRQTGETFTHENYTESMDESVRLTRLTFNEAIYEIWGDDAASPHQIPGRADLPVRPNLQTQPVEQMSLL